MADPKPSFFDNPLSPLVVIGGLALVYIGVSLALKKTSPAPEPVVAPPTPIVEPPEPGQPGGAQPGGAPPAANPSTTIPASPPNDYKPPAPKGSSSSLIDQKGLKAPFDHVYVLYTSRWVAEQARWGQWDGPSTWDGREVSPATFWQKAVWVDPLHEMLEQLEAISFTNQAPGYWMAYKLPIIEDVYGTRYGSPGPWRSGHFGQQIQNGDGSHSTLYTGFGPDGSPLSEVSASSWA